MADPAASGYVVRWPFYGGKFNTRDYPSNQMILSDIETILRDILYEKLGIEPRTYNVGIITTHVEYR